MFQVYRKFYVRVGGWGQHVIEPQKELVFSNREEAEKKVDDLENTSVDCLFGNDSYFVEEIHSVVKD